MNYFAEMMTLAPGTKLGSYETLGRSRYHVLLRKMNLEP